MTTMAVTGPFSRLRSGGTEPPFAVT